MASTEVRRVENEMMVSSFSRIRSEELNDMGYGLSKISPITFNGDAFQTPSNRTQDKALMLTPRKRRNEVNTESFLSKQVPQQSENPKSYNAELSIAGKGASEPSGRFISPQPQPSSTDNSSQDSDNSDMTTVFYEKSTSASQSKTAGMQTSPRDPGPMGTTTATQTSNRMTSQAGGTQTTPPPSPKKSTLTGGTQTSCPRSNSSEQVGQGQPDHNQDKEGQLTKNTSGKGKKNKKSTSGAPLHPGPSTGSSVRPRDNFMSRNLGTGRPTIQCTACGEYSHWRRECPYNNYCTTCNNHDHATHMCRACRHTNNKGQQGQQSPLICVYCGSAKHSLSNCHRRPWDNREQPHSTPDSLKRNQPSNSKISGNAAGNTASTGAVTHGCSSQSQYQRSNSKILGNSRPNNTSSQFFRNTNNSDYRESQRQPHAKFDERYNQRYSPPIFPLTPSLNSSFPEALSRSLLQIAENQSRTIDVMKASQEAQAAAYKEMTKTNKMRDDDALFHSIEVYDGSNPTMFEKWIDSIDQATHITGRDLRKELLWKSDSVIRNTLSMMDDR